MALGKEGVKSMEQVKAHTLDYYLTKGEYQAALKGRPLTKDESLYAEVAGIVEAFTPTYTSSQTLFRPWKTEKSYPHLKDFFRDNPEATTLRRPPR